MGRTRNELYVHLVWSTWDRLPLITPDLEPAIYRALGAECRRHGSQALRIGGTEDHVHLLVRIPTTLPLATLVKQLKGTTSHLVTHTLAPDRRFKWQGGYGAFTVSRWDLPRIEQYIRHQRKHHSRGRLSRSLEAICDE